MQLLLWAQSNSFATFLILLVIIYVLRELLIVLLKSNSSLLYLLFYPGVVIHELAHVIGCKLTGARVESVKLVSKTGGEVVHEKSKLPILGNLIISIFPLIFSALIIFIILATLKGSWLASLSFGGSLITHIVLYYLLVAVLLTAFPSSQDIKNAWFAYIVLIATAILIVLNTNWPIPERVLNLEIFCVITLGVVNLIAVIISYLKK